VPIGIIFAAPNVAKHAIHVPFRTCFCPAFGLVEAKPLAFPVPAISRSSRAVLRDTEALSVPRELQSLLSLLLGLNDMLEVVCLSGYHVSLESCPLNVSSNA